DCVDEWRVLVLGREVTRALMGVEIARGASSMSARPAVRDALLDLQRRQATPPGLVMEGRDVGTVVFPEAAVKFFITADAGERARRRWLEMRRLGREADLESIQREIRERDERDRTREAAPLVPAEDAALIDTTKMNVDEVVENMVDMALQRLSARM
ncbi:MAG: (d)CMP kinase, partial [Nitrospinota bacterium]|nr:(d)CMP kinase [Nitrospinota bacterium]